MNQNRHSLLEKDLAFRRYYSRYLQPLERQYEMLRRKAVREHWIRIFAALIAWLSALLFFWYRRDLIAELWMFIGFFALVTGVGLGMWAWLPAGAHRLRLQEQILSRIVPYFGDLKYSADATLVLSNYQDWMILPKYSKSYCEDQIEGSYRGVPLKLAEIRLEYKYHSGSSNNTSTRTVFKGLLVDFELDRSISGVTLIRSIGSDMNGDFKVNPQLSALSQASGFEVFANSEASKQNIAGIWLLEKIAKVSKQFDAKQLFASYHNEHLVMLIEHQSNYFEMTHRQKTDFAKDAERIKLQLDRFFSIVDLLQLQGKQEQQNEHTASKFEPTFPDLQDRQSQNQYDIGGWGCLYAFILYIAAIAVYIELLDSNLTPGELILWTVLGSFLLSLGLWRTVLCFFKRSFLGFVMGLMLLALAVSIIYFQGATEYQVFLNTQFHEIESTIFIH